MSKLLKNAQRPKRPADKTPNGQNARRTKRPTAKTPGGHVETCWSQPEVYRRIADKDAEATHKFDGCGRKITVGSPTKSQPQHTNLMAAAGRLLACHKLISSSSTRIQNSRKQMELHKLLDLTDVQRQQIRFCCKDQVLPGNPAIFDVFVKPGCRSVDVRNLVQ